MIVSILVKLLRYALFGKPCRLLGFCLCLTNSGQIATLGNRMYDCIDNLRYCRSSIVLNYCSHGVDMSPPLSYYKVSC